MHWIISVILWLALWGCALYVLWWGKKTMALGEPFDKLITVLLVILTVAVVLNPLFGYMPGPVIPWGGRG